MLIFCFCAILVIQTIRGQNLPSSESTMPSQQLSLAEKSDRRKQDEISSSLLSDHQILMTSSSRVEQEFLCRTEEGLRLPFERFKLESCAKCYFYMPEWAFLHNKRFRYVGYGMFMDMSQNRTFSSNETDIMSQTFVASTMALKWQECCFDALECCRRYLKNQPEGTYLNPKECPRTWDGWTCWPEESPMGAAVQKPCPAHIYWKITVPPCRGYVTKSCGSDGSWYTLDGREWSNYTNCARDDIYIRRLRYSILTHLISVSFIIPALVIFNYYRQLSSGRIRVHKHLFASLLVYAILSSLLKLNLLVTESNDEKGSVHASASSPTRDFYCMTLSLALRYFRSTTYLWMFNEAFYLYQLIKRAFTHPSVTPLMIIAYGIPFIITASYILCRLFVGSAELPDLMGEEFGDGSSSPATSSSEDACWMLPAKDGWKEWVINGPNLCILVVNCILLGPIIREIYKKAASMPCPHNNQLTGGGSNEKNLIRSINYSTGNLSKASFVVSLRAATLLLPLYGLHYLVIVYRPDVDICWLSELYHYLSLTLDGLQGCLVSILFCFGNNEVRQLLKRSLFVKRGESGLYMTEVVPGQRLSSNHAALHDGPPNHSATSPIAKI